MINSSLFSSESSVWNSKRVREFLYISDDQLNLLNNIPGWHKDISNAQEKDRIEFSIQNSQSLEIEPKIPVASSKENFSVSESELLQGQSLCNYKLDSCKHKSVSLSELTKFDKDISYIGVLKQTLSTPSICKQSINSERKISLNKTYTLIDSSKGVISACNKKSNLETMEVITQVDVNVSSCVKERETNLEIIQEEREEIDKQIDHASNNVCSKESDSLHEKEKHCNQVGETSASSDKMEFNASNAEQNIASVDSLSDKTSSVPVHEEKSGGTFSNESNSVHEKEKHTDQIDETSASADKMKFDASNAEQSIASVDSVSDKTSSVPVQEEKSGGTFSNESNSVQEKEKYSDQIDEISASSNKMEFDASNAEQSIVSADPLNDKTSSVPVHEEKSKEKFSDQIDETSVSVSSDKMEFDASNAELASADSLSDKTSSLPVNEKKSNEFVELNDSTLCDDKIKSSPNVPQNLDNTVQDNEQSSIVELNTPSNDKIETDPPSVQEAPNLVELNDTCDKMKSSPNVPQNLDNTVQDNEQSSIVELNTPSNDKIETDPPSVQEVPNLVKLNGSSLCDKMESGPNVTQNPDNSVQVNEQSNIVELNTSSDKMETDPPSIQEVPDLIGIKTPNENKKEVKVDQLKTLTSTLQEEKCDYSNKKRMIPNDVDSSIDNCDKKKLDIQKESKEDEVTKKRIESLKAFILKPQTSVVTTTYANPNFTLHIGKVPRSQFNTNEPSSVNVIAKKRKIEAKSISCKKHRSLEKHGEICYSREQIETMLDIMKQFL